MDTSELLKEIEEQAVRESVRLSEILRRCRVLAARLGNVQLESWVFHESNGYPEEVDVPGYRQWPMMVTIDGISGKYKTTNIPLSPLEMPQPFREATSLRHSRESIALIEDYSEKEGMLAFDTGDLVLAMNLELQKRGARFTQYFSARSMCSVSHAKDVLNAVRGRVLELVISLRKETGGYSGASGGTHREPNEERVSQIVHMTVNGGAVNITGTAANSTITATARTGDFEALRARLIDELGADASEAEELRNAVEEDVAPSAPSCFGPRVMAWLAKATAKLSEGAWKVTLDVGAKLLHSSLNAYYGFG